MDSDGEDVQMTEETTLSTKVTGKRTKTQAKRKTPFLPSTSSPRRKQIALNIEAGNCNVKTPEYSVATTDCLYSPKVNYFDLGYVTNSLAIHGVPKGSWSSRCYTFSFLIDPANFQNFEANQRDEMLTALGRLTHFRLLWTNKSDPVDTFGAAILIPPSVSQTTGLPLVIRGQLRFMEIPTVGRPGGWMEWRNQQEHLTRAIHPVDALRHFAVSRLPGQDLEAIGIPDLPVCNKGTKKFELCGEEFTKIMMPRLYPILAEVGKQLCFVVEPVRTLNITELQIDVYLTEATFHSLHSDEVCEDPSATDVKNGRRLRFLLDSFRPSTVTNSPFLETLVVEKEHRPVRLDESKKLFGDPVDPNDLKALFNHVKAVHANQRISTKRDPQHSRLKLKLYDYQRRAVSWMANREESILKNRHFPHPLFYPVELEPGKTIFTHYSTGEIHLTAPVLYFPRGGILADEMGLGKTLESLSLLLTNPKAESQPHLPEGLQFPKTARRNIPKEVHCHCANTRKITDPQLIVCANCGLTQHALCMEVEYLPKSEEFLCSTCQRDHRIECKTTLVVAPAALISQWKSEIEKSCTDQCLKVYEYRGISREGFISPWNMAQYDVVLASYEMLSRELLWLHAERRKASLRAVSTHQIIPCPLLALKFWRFVLDEAQMVESQTANYALMAMKIHANFYWAVTGTPIQQGILDLEALLSFIEMTPWNYSRWFEEYVAGPFRGKIHEPLQDILGECMWRLDKADVEAEMNLPVCTTLIHTVTFSGIEKQLYQQVYRDCIEVITSRLKSNPALRLLASYTQFASLDPRLGRIIKDWMGYLAKLCTSPTRVSYFFKLTKRTRKAKVAEDEGLDALGRVSRTLAEKAKLAFQNAFRACIMERNALAAYFWLNMEYSQAAEEYREAKRMCMETDKDIPVDSLQKLHIFSNLGELLATHGDTIPGRALEDGDLLAQAEKLRVDFVSSRLTTVESCLLEVQQVWEDVPHSPVVLDRTVAPIYRALNFVESAKTAKFLEKLKLAALGEPAFGNDLQSVRSRALPANYQTIDGLKFVLQTRWHEILEERAGIFAEMDKLIEKNTRETDAFSENCASCHLRAGMHIKRCPLCVVEKSFEAYEDLIFRTSIQGQAADDDDDVEEWTTGLSKAKRRKFDADQEAERATNWSDSDFDVTLKGIIRFVKSEENCRQSYHADARIDQEIQQMLRVISLLKKEYKLWRELWRSIYDYTSGCDEVKQAVLRVRFMTADEMEMKAALARRHNKTATDMFKWLMPPTENLRPKILLAQHQLTQAMESMRRTCTQFKYTRNMHQAYSQKDVVQDKECIVCFEPVGEKWAMFPCAHVICQGCLRLLKMKDPQQRQLQDVDRTAQSLLCPVCRGVALANEILLPNQVHDVEVKQHRFNAVNLRGAPTKVEAVVRTVFDLIGKDPSVKILIFSDYSDVLEDYADVLLRNGVAAHLVKAKAHIPTSIAKLRDGSAQILLMPISMGGKGLTITEANHLFFLEPLLNKGAELQAIGRIHRIGQTRPTFIHKFVVAETVEERIHQMMSAVGEKGSLSQKDLTLGQIFCLLKIAGSHGPDMEYLNNWLSLATRESLPEPSADENVASTSRAETEPLSTEF